MSERAGPLTPALSRKGRGGFLLLPPLRGEAGRRGTFKCGAPNVPLPQGGSFRCGPHDARNCFTTLSGGSADAPSTYRQSTIVPRPSFSAVLPT